MSQSSDCLIQKKRASFEIQGSIRSETSIHQMRDVNHYSILFYTILYYSILFYSIQSCTTRLLNPAVHKITQSCCAHRLLNPAVQKSLNPAVHNTDYSISLHRLIGIVHFPKLILYIYYTTEVWKRSPKLFAIVSRMGYAIRLRLRLR